MESKTLSRKGYKRDRLIANTLQGQVFVAKVLDNQHGKIDHVVIKTANLKLHQGRISKPQNGRTYRIKEDIYTEHLFLKRFSNNNAPSMCIKYYDFFWDKQQIYLVMEKAGQSLFEFVVQTHQLINCGKIRIIDWRRNVQFIFGQMVEFIYWMHHTQWCCNLDISLENIVFANEKIPVIKDANGLYKLNNDDLQIRFIDFGLCQQFKCNQHGVDFTCNDNIGKTAYKAPKVFQNKKYQANKADVWSLGVCLFMMIIGAPPYKVPNNTDGGFIAVKRGYILRMLIKWGRSMYLTQNSYDLLTKMLSYDEDKRIDIEGVMNHKWLKSYFNKRKSFQ